MATYALTDTLPAELRPFFPSREELVRRLDAVVAALRGVGEGFVKKSAFLLQRVECFAKKRLLS